MIFWSEILQEDKIMRIFASTPLLLTAKSYLEDETKHRFEKHSEKLKSLGNKITMAITMPGDIELNLISGLGRFLEVEVGYDFYVFDYKLVFVFECEGVKPIVIEEKIPVKLKRVKSSVRGS